MTGLLVGLGFLIAIIWVIYDLKKKKQKEDEKKGFGNSYYVRFYRLCLQQGITHANDETNRLRIQKVAKESKDFSAWGQRIESAVRLYKKGQKHSGKEENLEEYYKYYPQYSSQKETADYIGAEKYLTRAKTDLSSYEMLKPHSDPPKYKSVKGAALKGSLLFGQAYGVACAMEAQRYNERVSENAQKRSSPYSAVKGLIEGSRYYDLSEEELKKRINAVEARFYDDKQPQVWFNGLEFSSVMVGVVTPYALRVLAHIEVKGQYEIAEVPAALDGSLKFKIFDEKDTLVGEAYYSAPGTGDLSMENIGFVNGKISAICVPPRGVVLSATKKYRCEIEPYHLWLIEAGSNGPCPRKRTV